MASAMVEDEAGKGGQVVPHRGARGAARRAQDLKLLPSLSPLDFVDLGLVEPEPATGEDARAASSTVETGHFLGNTRGCGLQLQRCVRDAFEQAYSSLAADLERATTGKASDLQLAIIDTWGLVLAPDDHDFLSRVGIFRILHQVLGNARAALAAIDDSEGQDQAAKKPAAGRGSRPTKPSPFPSRAPRRAARQQAVRVQQRLIKATLRVVHMLASQVVLKVGALS